jgi:hypothetical protein
MAPKISGYASLVTIQEDKEFFVSIRNKIFIQYFAKKHLVLK